MTIVYCIASIYNSGGKDRVVCSKANHLVGCGHDVIVITTDQKGRAPFFSLDARVRCIDLGINYEDYNGLPIWERYRKRIKLRRKHRQALQQELSVIAPDVVISTFEEDAEILATMKLSCPKVMELHYSKERRFNEYSRAKYSPARLLDWWRTWRDERIVVHFDHLVALTETDRAKWTTARSSSTIPNPLPFAPRGRASLSAKRVLAVGRYSSEKDFTSLVDIWSMLEPVYPEWELEIVGDGYLRSSLEQQISRLGLCRVSLSPPTSDIQSKYLGASCLVMTSRYEGFGMVLIEAMSHGVPVVAYDCPYGPREIIVDGVCGYLVALGDKDSFAKRLSGLIDDETLRMRMGQEAFVSSKRFMIEHVMYQWEVLFERLIQRSGNE